MENFKRVHDSIKPPIWSRRFVAKFVWIQFGEWAERSTADCWALAKPETASHRAQLATTRAYQTCWLDWIMKCEGIIIIIHHYDACVWLIEWLSRNKSISCRMSHKIELTPWKLQLPRTNRREMKGSKGEMKHCEIYISGLLRFSKPLYDQNFIRVCFIGNWKRILKLKGINMSTFVVTCILQKSDSI